MTEEFDEEYEELAADGEMHGMRRCGSAKKSSR